MKEGVRGAFEVLVSIFHGAVGHSPSFFFSRKATVNINLLSIIHHVSNELIDPAQAENRNICLFLLRLERT